MAKLNYVRDALKAIADRPARKGIYVGSLFAVTGRPELFSFKWKGRVAIDGQQTAVSAKDFVQDLLDNGCFDAEVVNGKEVHKGMLVQKNTRQREGKRDPAYNVIAYPVVKE